MLPRLLDVWRLSELACDRRSSCFRDSALPLRHPARAHRGFVPEIDNAKDICIGAEDGMLCYQVCTPRRCIYRAVEFFQSNIGSFSASVEVPRIPSGACRVSKTTGTLKMVQPP